MNFLCKLDLESGLQENPDAATYVPQVPIKDLKITPDDTLYIPLFLTV